MLALFIDLLRAEKDRSAGRPRGADRRNGGVQVEFPHPLQPQPGLGRRFERPLYELSALRSRPRRRPPREREPPAPCVAKYLPRHRQAFFPSGFCVIIQGQAYAACGRRRGRGEGGKGGKGRLRGMWVGFSCESLFLSGSQQTQRKSGRPTCSKGYVLKIKTEIKQNNYAFALSTTFYRGTRV